jgi:hypothetical protein
MLLELHVAALLVDDDETRRPQRFQNLTARHLLHTGVYFKSPDVKSDPSPACSFVPEHRRSHGRGP